MQKESVGAKGVEKPKAPNFEEKLTNLVQGGELELTVDDIHFVRSALEKNFFFEFDQEARRSLFGGTNFGTLVQDGKVLVYDRMAERPGRWWRLEDGLSDYYYRAGSKSDGKLEDVTEGVLAAVPGRFEEVILSCYEIGGSQEEGRCLQLLLVDFLRLAILEDQHGAKPKVLQKQLKTIGNRITGCIARSFEVKSLNGVLGDSSLPSNLATLGRGRKLAIGPEKLLEFWKSLSSQ